MKDPLSIEGEKVCFTNKKFGKLFGSSTNYVYYLCDDYMNCSDFIAKILVLEDKGWLTLQHATEEAIMQQRAAALGVAPEVYSYGVCTYKDKRHFILEMRKIPDAISLQDIFLYHNDMLERASAEFITLLNILYDNEIDYTDLNAANFIYSTSEDRYYIIDYGEVRSGHRPVEDRYYKFDFGVFS